MTETAATRIAAMDDESLLSIHDRLDSIGPADPTIVHTHHLVTNEMAVRGHAHGHAGDEWVDTVVLVDEANVGGPEDIEAPEGMGKAWAEALADGGTVSVLLTVDGYVVKADPTVSDVHVDAVMGGKKRRKKTTDVMDDELLTDEYSKADWQVGDFATWRSSGGPARGRIVRIARSGSISVPDSSFTVQAEEDDPAVLLEVWREGPDGWARSGVRVGHKASTLTPLDSLLKADGYPVPAGVRAAAKQALEWIAEGYAGDGFTSVGRGRASQLAEGGSVGRETLVKMRAYFARHIVDKDAEGWGDKADPTPGMVAWYAWGGDAGRAWANRVLGDVEKAYEPEDALTPRSRAVYEALEFVTEQHGEFTPAEAHYMTADDNPFSGKGMVCSNCVFYEGGGGCEILQIQVEPLALCKFWVIDEALLKSQDEEVESTLTLPDGAVYKVAKPSLLDRVRAKFGPVLKHPNHPDQKVHGRRGGGGGSQAGGDWRSEDMYGIAQKSADEPVVKHPGHGDQKVHGRRGGGTSDSGAGGGQGSYKGYELSDPKNVAVGSGGSRSPEAAREAVALRERAAAIEPGVTRMVIDQVSEHGGTMEGLENRLKSDDSLARKIDADAVKEHDGDRAAAAAAVSDAIRFTAVFPSESYTDGVSATLQSLEDDGYAIRAKNFWQPGDPYQGMNVKATKDGITVELQFHTQSSLYTKSERLHPIYEEYRSSTDNRQRWKLWDRMVRIAGTIEAPADYDRLLGMGSLTMQTFETAQQAGLLG